jgi:hypothetical protein
MIDDTAPRHLKRQGLLSLRQPRHWAPHDRDADQRIAAPDSEMMHAAPRRAMVPMVSRHELKRDALRNRARFEWRLRARGERLFLK